MKLSPSSLSRDIRLRRFSAVNKGSIKQLSIAPDKAFSSSLPQSLRSPQSFGNSPFPICLLALHCSDLSRPNPGVGLCSSFLRGNPLRLHTFLSAEPHSLGCNPRALSGRLAVHSLTSESDTMNALRSSSASARRSLTPLSAPLSSSLLSSSFSTSSRSISTSFSRTTRAVASPRWSGPIPLNFAQIRTMASETKIKVKNPVVELDGDEVWTALL